MLKVRQELRFKRTKKIKKDRMETKEIKKSIFKNVGGFSTGKIEFTAGCFPRLPAITDIPACLLTIRSNLKVI